MHLRAIGRRMAGRWVGFAGVVLLAAGALYGQAASARAAETGVAFARVEHLRRGINLSNWYAQTGDYSAEKLSTYTTAADFRLIRELGFDHVRLSINPEPLLAVKPPAGPVPLVDPTVPLSTTATLPLRPEAMARLDETVRQINAAGLAVILDIHPEEGWERDVFTDEGMPGFLYFWRGFAKHFAATDPEKVYFELLNEPHQVSSLRWSEVQAKAVAVVRRQAPKHTIIVTGVEWGNIDGLLQLTPLADANLIYSFHDYEPMQFTHQGATWAGETLQPLRDVPYPSSPETIAPLLPALADPSAAASLEHYGQERWGRSRMTLRIQAAADWGRQHHVPVWCGEFGAYRPFSLPEDRARWLTDMRESFDEFHVGWAMWDYQAGFGLVTKKDGVTTVDKAIAQALGLNANP